MGKPSIIATIKSGQAIGVVQYFRETFNWLAKWLSNVKGDGIEILNKDSDYPTLKVELKAGDGINVTKENNIWTISQGDGTTDDKDSTGGKNGGGSGSGSGSSSGSGSGSGKGGSSSGSGSGSSSGSGSGSGKGGSSSGSGCNKWSGDVDNDKMDDGLTNSGDNCSELNGW